MQRKSLGQAHDRKVGSLVARLQDVYGGREETGIVMFVFRGMSNVFVHSISSADNNLNGQLHLKQISPACAILLCSPLVVHDYADEGLRSALSPYSA